MSSSEIETTVPEDVLHYDNSLREKHSEGLFLLVINLIVFLILFFMAYKSLKNLKVRLDRENDPKFKIVNGLILANGIRALSLIIVILLENNSGNSPTAWVNYLAHIVPSMSFLSGYMALVSLLADYYYTIRDETNHLVYLSLRLIIVFGYILLAIIALFSFITKNFKSFAYNSEFIIGIAYLITGSMIVYFGQLIGNFFEEIRKFEINQSHFRVRLFIIYLYIDSFNNQISWRIIFIERFNLCYYCI